MLVFVVKTWALVFVFIWLRWTLPRVRVDQMMSLCWKYLVPGAFLCFIVTLLWQILVPPTGMLVTGDRAHGLRGCSSSSSSLADTRRNIAQGQGRPRGSEQLVMGHG